MEQRFIDTATACLVNGDRLLFDTEMLSSSPRSLALAIIAEEEFAKGFLFVLVGKGIVPWNSAILRASRDHSCKQLLCLLMEYSDPELEEILARGKKREARHRETMRLYDELKKGYLRFPEISDAAERAGLIDLQKQLRSELNRLNKEAEDEEYFPPHIADAINLLRNEKIRRWEERGWYSDEKYDRTAQAIADGARDRDKQDALYVRVGKTGEVSSVPERIDEAAVDRARERAKKLRWFLKSSLDHGDHHSSEYERLLNALKLMFASPEELKVIFPETEETKANASE